MSLTSTAPIRGKKESESSLKTWRRREIKNHTKEIVQVFKRGGSNNGCRYAFEIIIILLIGNKQEEKGKNITILTHDPCKRKLGHANTFSFGDLLNSF